MKSDMRSTYSLLLLLLALALVVGGCAKTGEATPRPAETVAATEKTTLTPETDDFSQVVVLSADAPTTLDPCFMVSVHPEDSIAAHIWDTLVWRNDDLELEPRLAESWRLVNDLTWELDLRQGVMFHNGEPFNAQAVEFSLERSAQLEGSLETFASDVGLQSVEIIDDYTVRIHTNKPAVSMIYELFSVEMLPPVYYAQTLVKDLALNPVGSGPYRFVGWEPGVVLEANADYWQGVPDVDTLVFRTEPDADKRLSRLVAGEASLITDLSPDQAEAANTEHTRMMAGESTRRLFVGLRSQEGTPLADKRVRQALNYAVDVEALVSEFHAGYGRRYGSWANPLHADPDQLLWPYDPDKARDLLTQAGYPEGFAIAMDASVGRYYRDREIAEAIAAQLARLGVTATVQPWEWSVYVSERLIPKETAPLFLLGILSRGNELEDTRNLTYGFPYNPTLWYNEEFEQLLGEAERTFNNNLRTDLLRRAQVIAYDEAPWIWLWQPFIFYGVSQDLDWWKPLPDGLVYLYVPAPEAAVE